MSGISLAWLLLGTLPAHGYVITYDMSSSFGPPPAYAANADSFFMIDTFNLYSSVHWSIRDAQQLEQGGVRVSVDFDPKPFVLSGYERSLNVGFVILPESESSDVASVMVDAWAAAYLEIEGVLHSPFNGLCCRSSIQLLSTFGDLRLSGHPDTGFVDSDFFFGSHELLTKTRYSTFYWSSVYAEVLS